MLYSIIIIVTVITVAITVTVNCVLGDNNRVTVRPGFPGHILLFGRCLGVRAGFQKIGHMSGFCTLERTHLSQHVPKH